MTQFQEKFNRIKAIFFGNIGEINLIRRAENRAAENIPTAETYEKIITESNKIFASIPDNDNNCCNSLYIEVRRAAFIRLMFFNGRSPSELTNLKVTLWTMAKNNI